MRETESKMNNKPRAWTEEEVRQQFLDHIRIIRDYWLNLPDKTEAEKMDGLCFSFLTLIDGCGMSLPAINLSLSPHKDDKDFSIKYGENYYQPGMVFNDCYLHDIWYKKV